MPVLTFSGSLCSLQLQHPLAVGKFAAHQDAHQDVGDDAGVDCPPAVLFEQHEQGGEAAVEDEKAAPDLGNAAGVGHAFGRQVGVLQSGEAFDDGLFGKQAAAENGKHQRVDGDGIPIHRVGPSENQYGGEKGGKDNRRNALGCGLRHGGAYQPQGAHQRGEPEKRAVSAPVIPQKRIGEAGEGEQDFGKGHDGLRG